MILTFNSCRHVRDTSGRSCSRSENIQTKVRPVPYNGEGEFLFYWPMFLLSVRVTTIGRKAQNGPKPERGFW